MRRMASKRAIEKDFARLDVPLRELLRLIVDRDFGANQTRAAVVLKIRQGTISEVLAERRGIVGATFAALLKYDKEATLRALGSAPYRFPSTRHFAALARRAKLDEAIVAMVLEEREPDEDPGLDHFARRYKELAEAAAEFDRKVGAPSTEPAGVVEPGAATRISSPSRPVRLSDARAAKATSAAKSVRSNKPNR